MQNTRVVKKPIPFEFVLEKLERLSPYTKPMFGCVAVYVDELIVLILRSKGDYPRDNGIWIATTADHHGSLKLELPSIRSIEMFGPGPTGWQIIPEDSPEFEESAFRVCDLILARDLRIGKVPKRKKPKSKLKKRN